MAGQHIGAVAKRLGVPLETIRYYERCGLMAKPARTGSNYRLYSEEQIELLGFILNCRNLDMTHDEIRRLLKLRQAQPRDCTEVNALIDEHISHIDERIGQLRTLARQLKLLRASCNEVRSLDDCKIIDTLRQQPTPQVHSSVRKSHVGAHAASKRRS